MTDRDFPLPDDLPRPVDDGAADHLTGRALPGLRLRSTDARVIVLASLGQPRAVLYLYPMTGRVPCQNWYMVAELAFCAVRLLCDTR